MLEKNLLFSLHAYVRYALSGGNSTNLLIDRSEMFLFSRDRKLDWGTKTSGKGLFNILWLTTMLIFFGGGGG